MIFSGSNDCKIVVCTHDFEKIAEIDLKTVITDPIAPIDPRVRSITVNTKDSRFVVGTFGSELWEFFYSDDEIT